jgi:ribonuclease HI
VNNGLPAFSTANLQKAVVQSVATYGIEVYSVLDKSEMPLWKLKDLQVILNEQARRETGAFKTTPVGVLMAEGAMKPAKAILKRRTLGFSLRQLTAPDLVSENTHSPTAEAVEEMFRARCKWNLGVGGLEVEKTYPERSEDVSRGIFVCLDKDGAKIRAERRLEKGEFRIFTDGSRIDNVGSGAGVVVQELEGGLTEMCFSLGLGQEAYDAELFAVWQALEMAKRKQTTITKINIFIDAQSAMSTIRRDSTGPGQSMARAIRQTERDICDNIRITYNWVPSHCGILGNEKADELAKQGSDGQGLIIAFPYSYTKCDEIITLAHLSRDATESAGKVARAEVVKLLKPHKAMRLCRTLGMRKAFKPGNDYLPPKKKDTAVFTQMACGHALTAQHLHRFKQRRSDRCWWCKSGAKQTRGHLFGGCRKFRREYRALLRDVNSICRQKHRDRWKEGNLRQLFEEEGYELALISYMKKTGIGFRVDPEKEEDPEDGEDPPGNLRRYPEDIPGEADDDLSG